ncbi:MAG TPA: GNAT family N-acetyltransferase [Pyrinomonadaceae bacterium]|nr:GNAT family N-acetyltransferase [Pyrinomonadaceae bacterium]
MLTLETERLIFRPYTKEDRERLVALTTDAEVMRFVGDGVLSREAAESQFERVFTHVYEPRAFDLWAVWTKEGAYVGHAEIKPRKGAQDFEIIYLLDRAHWGRGYATEIARRLIRYGFDELGLARVTATIDAANSPSIRIVEKLGMRYEDEYEDEFGTTLVYAIEKPKDAR